MPETCSIPECTSPTVARGWCDKHYRRWRKHGDPTETKGTPNNEASSYVFDKILTEAFLEYDGDKCLIWPYGTIGRGYARCRIDGKDWLVSRYVCEQVNGAPPTPEHEAAHLCGKGHEGCITPKHLAWKTASENQLDRVDHNTHDQGERSFHAKLTNEQAKYVLSSKERVSALAKRFNVSHSTISMIRSGKRWGWLQDG